MIQKFLGTNNKTVAGVLAVFNRTLDDLKAVEIAQEAEATRQAQISVEAQAAHMAAIQEASAARDVQSKLFVIINPTFNSVALADIAHLGQI